MAKTTIQVNGNLGKDVEVKYSKAGKAYSVLTVGSTPSKKNAAGAWENGETMWFNITVFDELNPHEYKKGTPVQIDGTFTFRTFTRKDGTTGYALDVAANHIETVERKPKRDSLEAPIPVADALSIMDMPF